MAPDRFVVLGLAHARSEWFRRVAQWANSAALPVEFVKCVSPEELRARLASGRRFSALLADAGLPAVDRDLVDLARSTGCVVLVVGDDRTARDWSGIGVTAVLPSALARADLLDALRQHARPLGQAHPRPTEIGSAGRQDPSGRGRVATVCGAGGTGTSTVAIALAQGLACAPGAHQGAQGGQVLLADLALHAEQAMLHDARDVVPGIQELVEAHRGRRPSLDELRDLTFDVAERGYHLLLGIRRARYWSSLRPRAFKAGFESLRQAYSAVVCDADAEFEGEGEGGSVEVEERHLMARTAVAEADVVFAVGLPSMKGLHSLVRVIVDLIAIGTPPERIVPAFNRAPRSPRQRATMARALAELTKPAVPDGSLGLPAPLFLPERRVDEALRDGIRLPSGLTEPLAGAFRATLERSGQRLVDEEGAVLVRPGTLGHWTDQGVANG